jgi:hypothetical protein
VIEITESRPLSKTKNWVATRLVEKAAIKSFRLERRMRNDPQCGSFFFWGRKAWRSTHDQSWRHPAATTLMEYSEVEGEGCSIGPNPVEVAKAAAGKTIALFALPGAFTPTCSAKHVPGYVEQAEAFKAAGVDEIWCLSVNDAFVMGAWARDQKPARCACWPTAAPTSPRPPA